jgi:hypothetical protein
MRCFVIGHKEFLVFLVVAIKFNVVALLPIAMLKLEKKIHFLPWP